MGIFAAYDVYLLKHGNDLSDVVIKLKNSEITIFAKHSSGSKKFTKTA